MCAGGCCYFRPSKPHSGTLWLVCSFNKENAREGAGPSLNIVKPLVTPALVAASAQLVAGDAAGAGLALQHQPQVTTTAATAATPPPLHQPPQVPTQLANYRACAGITTGQEAAEQENGKGGYLLELSTVLCEILQCP